MPRHLHPFDTLPGMRTAAHLLDVSVKVEAPWGWMDLHDGLAYELEGSSFGERAVTWRRTEAQSPFIEGTFVTSAVRENVAENLAIWVRGDTYAVVDDRVKRLTEALSQLSYRMMLRLGDSARYWSCLPADYSITTSREFLHSRLTLVKATVPRRPAEEIVLATGDEL